MKEKIKNQFRIDQTVIRNVCSFYTQFYVFLMAAVFPFFLTWGYRYAGTDKSMLFRYLGLGLLFSVLPLSVVCFFLKNPEPGRKWWKIRPVSDYFILGYLITVIISYACSENKRQAFWGAEGWYIGLVTQLVYVASYFFISRFIKREKGFICLFVCSTGVTFVLGILNRFSVYPVKLEGANPSFIATLGNVNWYCGYWSVFFPLAAGLFYTVKKEHTVLKILSGLYLALAGIAGALQGSDSAILVFASVFLVLFFVSAKQTGRRKQFYETGIVLTASFQTVRLFRYRFPERINYDSRVMNLLTEGNLTLILLILFAVLWIVTNHCEKKKIQAERILLRERNIVLSVISGIFLLYLVLLAANTVHPGSIGRLSARQEFIFNADWGSSRGATWMAGMKVFGDQPFLRKLIGLGPDCFEYGVYKEGSSAANMVRAIWGNVRLTNAHNEWITVLVNFGISGLFFYLGTFLSKTKKFLQKGLENPIVFSAGLSLTGYMSNNLFSFQQVLNGPFVFIMMGIGEAVLRKNPDKS